MATTLVMVRIRVAGRIKVASKMATRIKAAFKVDVVDSEETSRAVVITTIEAVMAGLNEDSGVEDGIRSLGDGTGKDERN